VPELDQYEGGLPLFFSNERVDEEVILLGHFQQRVIELQSLEGGFWLSTTRRNLPITEISRTWWELPTEFPLEKIEIRKYATI
jgi:hypothetical protein